jgi:pyruvate dehydrogenase E2 component (dihydrolipoamide acetyltransferase)
VDLATVRAAKGGRISVEDVEAAGGPAARTPLSRMRRAIAERMTHSFRDVPQYSVSSDIDMTAANAARMAAGVSYADVLISAVGRTLRDHPRLATRYDPDGLIAADGIHIGIAVALDDGLIVPVLREADTKSLRTIALEARDLAERARAGKLRQPEIEGGTFTVSNMGMLGVSAFAAIINPPESAILAVSATIQRPVVRDGAVTVGDIMSVTLSCDHRACSGADGARLLQTVKRHLEAPTLLLA